MCSQDVLGDLFVEAMPHVCTARNIKDRAKELFGKIKAFYKKYQVLNCSKLQNLTPEMLKKEGKSPKLKAKGAETRHLVPFAVELGKEFHEIVGSSHTLVVYKMVCALFDIYMSMSTLTFDAKALAEATRKFCVLYSSLSKEAQRDDKPLSWRAKPKLHLAQEMGEFQSHEVGNPRLFWCYRDESFVGFAAQVISSRGGGGTASTNPLRAMERYRALCTIDAI